MRKSSSAVKTAFEQATGTSTGGWELPFKGQGLAGLTQVDDSFYDSRLGHVAQKFIPMSLASLAQGNPTSFVAPMSRGVTKGSVTYSMGKTLEAYLSKDALPKHLRPADLTDVVAEIIHAAEVNGIDPEAAFKAAQSRVVGNHYLNFFRALNDGDGDELEKEAEKIIRLNKGVEDFHANMTRRYESYGREYGPDLRDAVGEAFKRASER